MRNFFLVYGEMHGYIFKSKEMVSTLYDYVPAQLKNYFIF
jgi:hypothetical protein